MQPECAASDLGWMLIRGLVVQGFAFGAVYRVLGAVLGEDVGGAIYAFAFVVAALWCIWDANRQCPLGQDRAYARRLHRPLTLGTVSHARGGVTAVDVGFPRARRDRPAWRAASPSERMVLDGVNAVFRVTQA